MSSSGQTLVSFVIGGVVGLLVGWNLARARSAPVSEDVATQVRSVWTEIVTFVRNAVLVAVAAVVILVLAANIVHSRR